MDTESRRSGRRRQPSKKYTVDAFEGVDLTSDLESDLKASAGADDSEEDDDFQVDQAAEAAEEVLSQDGELEVDLLEDANGASDADAMMDEVESVVDEDLATPGPDNPSITPRGTPGRKPVSKFRQQARGLLATKVKGGKHNIRRNYFGPGPEDQQPALQANYKWSGDLPLPTRKATPAGFGGFHRGFYRTDEMRKREMNEDWKWYDDEGGREQFHSLQLLTTINAYEAFLDLPLRKSVDFLMGPYMNQKLFTLSPGSAMNLNDVWSTSGADGNIAEDAKSLRYGWMLNLGEKVQCLDWAPNQGQRLQYLAVSTLPQRRPDSGQMSGNATPSSAFAAQPSYRSSIQIWEVSSDEGNYIDTKQPPRLRLVICTQWGDVKSFKWCPVPRKEDPNVVAEGKSHLGLLAGVWGDGAVRVLDVSIPPGSETSTQYIRYTSVAFQAKPPHTLCTSVAWLSSTGIAAGCANGNIGIWNIPSSINSPSGNAEPVFFSALQLGYVLSLTSCYPSRPQILLSASISGHIAMTDLTSISSAGGFSPASTVLSMRSRIAKSLVVWHDWGQMVLTIDDNNTLCGYPLRRFYSHIGLTRFKGPCMALAVSPVHPFIMAGSLAGEVVGHNPMSRVFNIKSTIWNQVWFTHAWRRTTEEEQMMLQRARAKGVDSEMLDAVAGAERTDDADQARQSPGLVRIAEGFKTELVKLAHNDDASATGDPKGGYTTIYELETAVTQVAWNPNMHVGGWVAAGMASGLLRIEDVAI